MHKIPWQHGSTYNQLVDVYVSFVTAKYKEKAVVVFDGYRGGGTTKDVTHLRRSGHQGSPVHFTGDMVMMVQKMHFSEMSQQRTFHPAF